MVRHPPPLPTGPLRNLLAGTRTTLRMLARAPARPQPGPLRVHARPCSPGRGAGRRRGGGNCANSGQTARGGGQARPGPDPGRSPALSLSLLRGSVPGKKRGPRPWLRRSPTHAHPFPLSQPLRTQPFAQAPTRLPQWEPKKKKLNKSISRKKRGLGGAPPLGAGAQRGG